MLMHYFLRHLQAMLNSLGQLSRAPFTTLMICLIVGVTLALPTALFVLVKNLEGLMNNLQQTTQITLYLKINTSEKEAQALVKELNAHAAVRSIKLISPEQGLQEFQQRAGIREVSATLAELKENPLPWTLVISPDNQEDLKAFSQELEKLPQVDSVQLDLLWVQRLNSLLKLAKLTATVLSIFLGWAVFIIIHHSIRSATQQNEKEIKIIQLMGGTNAFIRRPFVYAGMLYGLLGGIMAWLLVDMFVLSLEKPTHHLAVLYESSFQLAGVCSYNTLILLGISMWLGMMGAWVAVAYCLRK